MNKVISMLSYRKGENQALDAAFRSAEQYGSVRIGRDFLFCRKIVKWDYIDLERIDRAWRRIEEVRAKTGCCSNDFSRHFLKLLTNSGEEITLKIGEALYRHEPEMLIEAIQRIRPEIAIGKPNG